MRKIILGGTGMEIGRVVFGGIICMNEEQRDADAQVAYAVENGVNYFDVAPSYGDSELKLGPALFPYRKNVFLACKTAERTAEKSKIEFENSLIRLKTDYFDNYQLHALSASEDADAVFAKGGAMETLIKAKADGRVKRLGLTSHNAETALIALNRYDFDTVMFPVNWALGLGTAFEGRLIAYCKEKNIGLLGMKTLAHRKWREGEERAYPKSWCRIVYGDDRLGITAVKYTLSRGAHAVVPPGNFDSFSFCLRHIDACADNPLNDEDTAYLTAMLPDGPEQIFN